VQRIFAGVEATAAGLHHAIQLEGLTDRVLHAFTSIGVAGEILVEAFVRDNDLGRRRNFRGRLDLRGGFRLRLGHLIPYSIELFIPLGVLSSCD
jgi:hypothetical protein